MQVDRSIGESCQNARLQDMPVAVADQEISALQYIAGLRKSSRFDDDCVPMGCEDTDQIRSCRTEHKDVHRETPLQFLW